MAETIVESDSSFFESGEDGVHRLINHTGKPCIYRDMRSYIGRDVCQYPDSDKIIMVPNGGTFRRNEQHPYFDGETDEDREWNELK